MFVFLKANVCDPCDVYGLGGVRRDPLDETCLDGCPTEPCAAAVSMYEAHNVYLILQRDMSVAKRIRPCVTLHIKHKTEACTCPVCPGGPLNDPVLITLRTSLVHCRLLWETNINVV